MTDIVERLRTGRSEDSHFIWTVTPTHIEAADEITRLRQLLSEAEKRERDALTQLSEIAKKEAEGLMDKWISDQGTTVETKAAGVASHIVNDFRGHIEAALIKLERRAALERSEGPPRPVDMEEENV